MESWYSRGCIWMLGAVIDLHGGLEESWLCNEAWSSQ